MTTPLSAAVPAARRLLMIAFHFPPLAGSSGIQRTLRFVQQLPALGWEPVVLTVDARAYERTSDDLLADVPASTPVTRAFALDTARHLRVRGRYMAWMARPDRWISWRFDGVRQGLKLIEQYRPAAIWSTYPIATAHVIGHALQRRTGLPWIADFRDPMAQDGYPADPRTWRSYQRIEQQAMARARCAVFTTPGAARDYRARYPAATAQTHVIENGYDEESFAGVALPTAQAASAAAHERPLVLLHSGIVYPSERDPEQLFAALRLLVDGGRLQPGALCLRFRASVHDDLLRQLAQRHGVQGFIDCAPAISYRAALAEMLAVDGLLVLQASNCNAQIPAKIYEYMRAGRPIVGLTDPAGDTAAALRGAGTPYLAPLDDAPAIAAALQALITALRDGRALRPDPLAVAGASRHARTRALADVLAAVAA